MGRASGPSLETRRVESPASVRVIDTIEIKASLPVDHAPGLVVILEDYRPSDLPGFVGRTVRLRDDSGRTTRARIEDVRDHGATVSFFFPGLSTADVPVGSRVEFGDGLGDGGE
ncbi:MAG TPA: hypothetical protein VG406_26000 [Isosphaeraceae bacterium]|nr:hypothetical protein [Isosphaeraceae bacterium]